MKKAVKKYPEWMIALIPAILAIVLYVNTIPNKYCLDDYCVIVNNSYVQSGFSGIPKLVSTNFFNGMGGFNDGLYRPVPMVTYAIEYGVFGMNPAVSHAVNMLFFSLTSFIVFLLMRKLFGEKHNIFALTVTLLFVTHPIHTEVVGNIKGRDDLLAFVFGILAMFYLLRNTSEKSILTLVLGLVFYVLSLLSKESSLMFLFVIPIMISLFTKASNKSQWMLIASLSVITVIWLVARYLIVHSMPNPIDSGVFSELNNSILSTNDVVSRAATGLYLQFLYLAKLVVPFWLSHDYSYNQIPVIGIVSFKFLLALIVIFGALAILAVTYKRNKLIFFGVLFYFLTLATVSNIVFYIGATFAERFLFTPSFGFAIVTGSLLVLLLKNVKTNDSFQQVFAGNKAFTAILFFVLIVYSVTTLSRNRDWKDNLSLYATDVNRSTNSARAHYNYGSALMANAESGENGGKKMEMLQTASVELKKALAIYAGYTDAYNNLGNVYSDMGQKDSAIYYYAQTLKMDSGYMKGYFNLGINYYSLGRYAEAIPMLGKYAMYKPETPQIYYYIGNSYGGIGKFDEAIICLEKNLTLGGENLETLVLLGKAYGFKKQLDKSVEIFNRAFQLDPNNSDLLFNLGLTYTYLGQPAKSIEFFQRSIQVSPSFVPAYYELANAYDRVGKGSEAAILRLQAAHQQQK